MSFGLLSYSGSSVVGVYFAYRLQYSSPPFVRLASERREWLCVGAVGMGVNALFFPFFLSPNHSVFLKMHILCLYGMILPNLLLSSDRQGIRLFPVDMYYNPTSRMVRYIFPSIIEARSGSPRVCIGLTDLRPSVFTTRITYCSPLSHVKV